MLESLFRLLFNYRPVVFQQGEFRLVPSAGSYIAAALVAAAIAATFLTYRSAKSKSAVRHRLVLAAIRTAILLLVLFCLFRPVLVVRAAVPQQNFLGVLIDDSRSMQIADWNQAPRANFVRQEFATPEAPILKALADRFVIRTFRFSSAAARVGAPSDLTFAGGQTRIGAVARRRPPGARRAAAGRPRRRERRCRHDRCLALGRAAGDEGGGRAGVHRRRRARALAKDVQVDRVSTPKIALKGTSLMIDVVVTQTGFAGETVTLDVEDGGRIVGSQEVKLPMDGEPAAVRGALHRVGGGPAGVQVPDRAAPRRARHSEQPARGARRGARSPREDPVLRGRAALRR